MARKPRNKPQSHVSISYEPSDDKGSLLDFFDAGAAESKQGVKKSMKLQAR